MPIILLIQSSVILGNTAIRMAPPPGRLYAKAVFTGFKRALTNQRENTALLKVEGCDGKDDARWYIGKRCAYVYRVRFMFDLELFKVYLMQCSCKLN